jgi:outer membrane protein OmpA-like peptidoglycan-associated protein
MSKNRFSVYLVAGIAFSIGMLLPSHACAQENMDPETGLPRQLAPGECADLSALRRLVSAVIVSCDKQDYAEVSMPLNPDAQGNPREKTIRGAYEFRSYQIAEQQVQAQAFDTLTQLLDSGGYKIKYSSNPGMITGRKENTWIMVQVKGEYYDVTVVRAKEEPWTPVKSAQEISQEMDARNHVALYGIVFSPDNQFVVEQNSRMLFEALTYLKANPGLTFEVESHKVSSNESAEADLEITKKRAKAVVDWFQAHGVPAGRLQAKGSGRNNPVTENDTPLEIFRNERIELAKIAP